MNVDGLGVVVTGAGSGIGRAIAGFLAAEGARLVINDVDGEAASRAAADLDAVGVAGDVGSEQGIADLVERAHEHLGEVDIWFSNAGVDRGRGLDTSEADWDLSHRVNVMSHVRTARLLMPRWAERGSGRFVITASAAGLLTMIDAPAYSVTKHASVAFGEWLSATYRHRGIVVQVLCPQGVRTRMLESTGDLKGVLTRDGLLEPEDVAAVVRAALDGERFHILPHPEVGDYLGRKGQDIDRWLGGMNRLQVKLESEGVEA